MSLTSAKSGPVLSARLPLELSLLVLAILGPATWWWGAAQPLLLGDWTALWLNPGVGVIAAGTAAALFLLPLSWIFASRTVDLLSLVLAQNALLIVGYFFLETTAYKLDGQGDGILHAAPLVVLINAAGFSLLLATLGLTYLLAVVSRARLRPIHAPPQDYDHRLRVLLLATGLIAGAVIALPMALSGTIPMLAADPVAARFAMIKSDVARALYHMGTALLPFVVGGLLTGILRHPRRALLLDGWLAGGIVLLQILTSNRLPLAITLLVTTTLFSLERRLPRWLLLGACLGYIILFAGLSGFTSILRQDRSALEHGNIVQASLSEAFLGDNLIDVRDAAWVFSHWNQQPYQGQTYLGGLVAMLPSGVFPQKKMWHLGLTGVRIVGWDPEEHFGLRITFFGESFLNFGWAGVAALAIILGGIFGVLLRTLHLAGAKKPPCLAKNLVIVLLMQMSLPLANTSDAFTSWSMLALLLGLWLWVDLPIRLTARARLAAELPIHG